MRKILLALFVLAAHAGFAQYLEISGRVNYFDLKPNGKIYYTEPGKKFDPKVFIQYDKNFNYTFKIRIKDIREKNIQALVFTLDTGSKSNEEYACTQRFNLGVILGDAAFSQAKSIKLTSDLLLDYNCSASVAYGAAEQGMEDWVGEYTMKQGDTVSAVSLKDIFFSYTANADKRDKEFMNRYRGSWRFDAEKKKLTITIYYRMNEQFGIIINRSSVYEFDAPNGSSSREFKGNGVTLSRR